MSVCAAACLAIAPLRAQVAAPRGTLDGIVTDTSLAPLSSASVWILGTKLEVSTGDNGRFRITGIPAGTYIVYRGHSEARICAVLEHGERRRR